MDKRHADGCIHLLIYLILVPIFIFVTIKFIVGILEVAPPEPAKETPTYIEEPLIFKEQPALPDVTITYGELYDFTSVSLRYKVVRLTPTVVIIKELEK